MKLPATFPTRPALALLALSACVGAAPAPTWIAVGEGLTGDGAGAFEAAPRLFTAADDFCAGAPAAASLRAAGPDAVASGAATPLSALGLTARDGQGRPLPSVPVAIELDQRDEEKLDRLRLRESGELVFPAPGKARVRFRTLCQSPELTAVQALEIRRAG